MDKGLVGKEYLESIADAIRDANGTYETYKPSEMARAIYDVTYHIVPVQISNVRVTPATQYFPALYSYDFSVVNDKPDEYPNLLFAGLLSQVNIDTSKDTVSFTNSEHINKVSSFPIGVSSDNFDENNFSGYVVAATVDPRLEQQYFVYGKRKE